MHLDLWLGLCMYLHWGRIAFNHVICMIINGGDAGPGSVLRHSRRWQFWRCRGVHTSKLVLRLSMSSNRHKPFSNRAHPDAMIHSRVIINGIFHTGNTCRANFRQMINLSCRMPNEFEWMSFEVECMQTFRLMVSTRPNCHSRGCTTTEVALRLRHVRFFILGRMSISNSWII